MASSSSPSSSSPTSQCKYDLFISFRGKDTGYNFTSHLYAALRRKEIKAFVDDAVLKRVDEIFPDPWNAIEESKASVIILTKNYASSTWCLNELVKILECHKIKRQIVIPVFYGVNPSDVRKQTGSFGEAFSLHENNFNKIPGMVQRWRDALMEAANLSGYTVKRDRSGLEFIDEILNDIYNKNPEIRSFKNLIGLDSRIEDVESLLRLESPGFRIIGLWGVDGIGKTTLAEALFKKVSKEFEGRCIMINVREKLEQGVGLVHLQQQALSQLLKENIKVGDPEIWQNAKKRLRDMKVFIVLDDVSESEQLEHLTGPEEFAPGSRIIIITKNKQVLGEFGVDYIYQVEPLDDHGSFELFCNYAFGEYHWPQGLMVPLSSRIVHYAKGHPLALKVLGSFLRGKSEPEWESALLKLQQIRESSINDVLKISYDGLGPQEKETFLKIACYYKGHHKDDVARNFDDPDFIDSLNDLVDKSFITILDNKLEVHVLLQEMGKKILSPKSLEAMKSREDLKKNKLISKQFSSTNLIVGRQSLQQLGNREDLKKNELVLRNFLSTNRIVGQQLLEQPGNPENLKKNKEGFQLQSTEPHHSEHIVTMPDELEPAKIKRGSAEDSAKHRRLWHPEDVYHALKKKMGCELLRNYKKQSLAAFFFLLEAISVVLDHLGNSKLGFPLAAFILSAFGFASSIYVCCVEGGSQGTTSRARIPAESQLSVLEVVFSTIQLIVSCAHFILAVLDVKNSYNFSFFPLAFALVGLCFSFQQKDVHSTGVRHLTDGPE